MKHLINGCKLNLRELAEDDLNRLIAENDARRERLADEQESLVGELVRRAPNVISLF